MTQTRNDGRPASVGPIRMADADLLGSSPSPNARRAFAIGLFSIVSFVAVVLVVFLLSDPAALQGRYPVRTSIPDAGGLRRGDPVQMRGVNIGRVEGFAMADDAVLVNLSLERGYPIPADSRIVLRSSGLLGGMIAEVIPGRSTDRLSSGSTLPGGVERDVFSAAADLSFRADTVLTQVQALLSDRNVSAVGESAVEMRELLALLTTLVAEQRTELRALSGTLRRSAEGIERATTGPELPSVMARMDTLSAQLGEASLALTGASTSLQATLDRLEQGQGTLGRLSRDDALYESLHQAADNLNRLAEDIRQNPRRYINVRVF
ncbi:MAG: MlaD family protein [Gemmatimonadota bacterium]|nr:MlaD family protein [Gemmatimonadota bacterium]